MHAKERVFRFGRHYRRIVLPLLRSLRLSHRVLGAWYPMPFTASMLEIGAAYPSSVVMSCDLPAVPAGAWLARAWGSSFLYDSHELYPEQANYDKKQKYVLNAWENWGIRQATIAYTNSANNAKYMAASYPGIPQPLVITNAAQFPPITLEKGAQNPLRRAAGISDHDFVFIYHGGFSPHRNLETMIEGFAAANLPDTHLVMMGYGDTDLVKRVIRHAKAQNVHLLPAVPQEELGLWVKGANMVVIPYPAIDENTRFCSPNKLFDCIEIDAPVMVNRGLVTVGEIVQQYGIGAPVAMDDVDSMAQSFIAMRNAPSIDPAKFEIARASLGWPAQAEIINRWIDQIETATVKKTKVSA